MKRNAITPLSLGVLLTITLAGCSSAPKEAIDPNVKSGPQGGANAGIPANLQAPGGGPQAPPPGAAGGGANAPK